jgi:hypothetical protein
MTLRVLAVRLFQTVAGRYGNVLIAYRSWLVFGAQWLLIALANATAFALRFDGAVPPEYLHVGLKALPLVLLAFGSSLWVFGIQRGL